MFFPLERSAISRRVCVHVNKKRVETCCALSPCLLLRPATLCALLCDAGAETLHASVLLCHRLLSIKDIRERLETGIGRSDGLPPGFPASLRIGPLPPGITAGCSLHLLSAFPVPVSLSPLNSPKVAPHHPSNGSQVQLHGDPPLSIR